MATRYELDGKYWEYEATGKTAFTARWGKVGAASRSERAYTFPDAAALTKARDKLVAEKLKAGFALVGASKKTAPAQPAKAATPAKAAKTAKATKPAGPKTNSKLEAMLADNPDDAGTWQVYADWLQENGEPWGEVIAAASTGKKTKKKQDEAATAILAGLDGSSIKWKHGTIETLELCPEPDAEDAGATAETAAIDYPMPQALARALAHPGGRFVRELVLGLPPTYGHGMGWSFDSIIPVIVKAGPLPLLARIDMSRDAEHMDQTSWRRIGDLRKLWAAAPRLRELKMLGARGSYSDRKHKPCQLGDIVAPHLERFTYISGGLDKSISIDLGKAKLPALRHLELLFGREDHGNDHTMKSLAGILDGKGLPKLEYLGLKNSEWETELIETVAKSAIVKRLRVLDLSMGTLYTEGGAALLKHAAKFRHLDKLDLDENFLTEEHVEQIEEAIPCAHIGSQREPDHYEGEIYRFAVIGE